MLEKLNHALKTSLDFWAVRSVLFLSLRRLFVPVQEEKVFFCMYEREPDNIPSSAQCAGTLICASKQVSMSFVIFNSINHQLPAN